MMPASPLSERKWCSLGREIFAFRHRLTWPTKPPPIISSGTHQSRCETKVGLTIWPWPRSVRCWWCGSHLTTASAAGRVLQQLAVHVPRRTYKLAQTAVRVIFPESPFRGANRSITNLHGVMCPDVVCSQPSPIIGHCWSSREGFLRMLVRENRHPLPLPSGCVGLWLQYF